MDIDLKIIKLSFSLTSIFIKLFKKLFNEIFSNLYFISLSDLTTQSDSWYVRKINNLNESTN